jgi:hypothetical protein
MRATYTILDTVFVEYPLLYDISLEAIYKYVCLSNGFWDALAVRDLTET